MRSDWDTPTLAMAEAMNEFVGQQVSMITLKQAWQYYVGNDDHSFAKALDRAMTLWPGQIEAVYIRKPGWFTEVQFKILGEVRLKYK